MNYYKFRGLLRASIMLTKGLMEQCNEEFIQSLEKEGGLHHYLYTQVDNYLRENGVKADRKSINVLVDSGKELFINVEIKSPIMNKLMNEEIPESKAYKNKEYYENIEY